LYTFLLQSDLLTGPLLFDFELLFELPDVLFLCLYAQLEFSLLLQLLLQSFLHLIWTIRACSILLSWLPPSVLLPPALAPGLRDAADPTAFCFFFDDGDAS